MNILVAGADGFIGSHMTEELVKSYQYNSFNNRGWLDMLLKEIMRNVEILRRYSCF